MTYDPIASTTLASSASSVTFSSLDTIAAGYRDLIVVIEGTTGVFGAPRFFVNSSVSHNQVDMSGNGSSTASSSASSQSTINTSYWGITSGTRYICKIEFFDFAATDKHKSVLYSSDGAANQVLRGAGRAATTSAITSITLEGNTNFYTSGTTFSLYGIAA